MNVGAPRVAPVAVRAPRLIVVLLALMGAFAAAPAAALANTIQGTVTDAGGANLGGVQVQAYDSSHTPIAPPGGTATTAANGTYTLTVVPGSFPATYYVGFQRATYTAIFYNQQPTLLSATPITLSGAGSNPTGINAQMTPAPGAISGRVKDAATGTGISGVPIQVLDTGGNPTASGTSAPDGSFSIQNIPPGNYKVFFGASAAGDYNDVWYLSKPTAAQADVVTVQANATTPLADQPLQQLTGHITGQVTNSAGAPVAGVNVDANGPGGGSSAVTGPDGAYTITGLSTGDYTVHFTPPSGQNLVANYYNNASGPSSATPVHVVSGQTTPNINSTLQPGGAVSGTITTAADGSPVSGAAVQILDASEQLVRSGLTAANGQYSINGLPSGTYFVQARPPSSANLASRYYGGGSDFGSAQPVTVTAGQTTGSINVALPAGGQITGRVTDSAGNPVAGASVDLFDMGGSGSIGVEAITGADGTYTLKQVPPGTFAVQVLPGSATLARTFYVSAPDVQLATGVAVASGQTVSGINVVLPAGAGVTGRVTLAGSGAPIGNVDVSLLDGAGNTIAGTSTDSDGSYKFTDVFPTAVKVLFTTSAGLGFQYYNNATTLPSATPVSLIPGQTASGINAALSPGGTVTGTVTDAASHAGVAGVAATLLDDQGTPAGQGAVTHGDGTYTIYGVAPGTYFVRFSDDAGHRPPYRTQYLGGSVTLAGSNRITVAAGRATSGVDAALVRESAPAPGGTVTTVTSPPVTVVKTVTAPVARPGKPSLRPGALTGLRKRHATLRFTAKGGSGGVLADIIALKIRLPKGLSFKPAGLARGLRIAGGTAAANAKTATILIAFQKPTHSLTLTVTDKLLVVSKSLATRVKKKRIRSISIPVEVDNASGVGYQFTLKFTKLG